MLAPNPGQDTLPGTPFDLLAGVAAARQVRPVARLQTILVFDSGLGGLTVHAEIARAFPGARFVYAADDAGFPYGRWPEAALTERVCRVVCRMIERFAPDLVVIACNTASTLVLPHLRARFAMPFVGTVPAVKPAAEGSRSRIIAVLATPGTVRRDYTRGLIRAYAGDCRVELVGSQRLAALAERSLRGEAIDDVEVAAEIAPCFVMDGERRTDAVVLACTHYPLLVERFRALAPWPVAWVDPAPAIARRVASLAMPGMVGQAPRGIAVFTGARPPAAIRDTLGERGFGDIRVEDMAVDQEDGAK